VRALFVAAMLALLIGTGVPSQAGLVAPRPGQSLTQTDLLSYLFMSPQPGDWMRYDVFVNGRPVVTKTIGFGAESLHGTQSAYFEIRTQTPALEAVPVSMQPVTGGAVVWKMYVDAADFNDSGRLYSFAGGMIKIGDSLFRLGGNPLTAQSKAGAQTLESLLLFGLLPIPDDRTGTVVASLPEVHKIGDVVLQTVHTTVDFSPNDLGMAAGLPASRVETWQTSEVPLGLVGIRVTQSGSVFSMNLAAFGRGTYHEQITSNIDTLPYFPGS
jgi:hypothetical protein